MYKHKIGGLLKECTLKGSERGVKNGGQQKEKILEAVRSLAEEGKDQETTSGNINASWKLLWTTEKVAQVFRTSCPRSVLMAVLSPKGNSAQLTISRSKSRAAEILR